MWCVRIRSCEPGDVLLRLVFWKHILVATIFNENVSEDDGGSEPFLSSMLSLVFLTSEDDVGLWFRGYSERRHCEVPLMKTFEQGSWESYGRETKDKYE